MADVSLAVWAGYVLAGGLMPLFYVSQVAVCLRDRSGLSAYSVSKCAIHVCLRLVMMPFIVLTGSPTMTVIVGLDLAGRLAELAAALLSLHRQGWTASQMTQRIVRLDFLQPEGAPHGAPTGSVRHGAPAGQAPVDRAPPERTPTAAPLRPAAVRNDAMESTSP